MKYYCVRRTTDKQIIVPKVRWCDSFICKLFGLTFRRRICLEDALVLVEQTDSSTASSIHMMFVFQSISAIWINDSGKVVDCKLAKPFRPIYIPKEPARYVLEGPPDLLKRFSPGDEIRFEPLAS